MQTLEALLQVAAGHGEVFDMARALIGTDTLAMLIATSVLSGTTEQVSPTRAAEVLGIAKSTASDRIQNTAVKTQIRSV